MEKQFRVVYTDKEFNRIVEEEFRGNRKQCIEFIDKKFRFNKSEGIYETRDGKFNVGIERC